MDAVAISLFAKGLTTGEMSAHFREVYGAFIYKDTVSRITDKVLEEMAAWASRPLQGVYAAIFIDSTMTGPRLGGHVRWLLGWAVGSVAPLRTVRVPWSVVTRPVVLHRTCLG